MLIVQSPILTILPEEKAILIAQQSLSHIHGAVLLARLFEDSIYIETMCEDISSWWLSIIDNTKIK